ncbi:hypothetical protein SAMN05720759_10982 [Fibrobacter sp. UWB12]|nr:hypothetical protein SAMN05720759_10982 [Fibrobacter sp. UWB12]
MDLNTLVDYCFWTPVFLWAGLHFWFRNVSYTVFMKKQLNRGEKWAYVLEGYVKHPGRVNFLRFFDVVFTVVASVATAVAVVWSLQKFGLGRNSYYGFLSLILFVWAAHLMKRRTEVKVTDLFQSAFYLEYRWVNYEIQRKGISMSEENVRDRAGLSFAHKLRNAEDHHRFWRYVKAMAVSKKVPPEMFEVY